MDLKELELLMQGLAEMPEEELKYVSKTSPEKTMFDLYVWKTCKDKGDMSSWEKLKTVRGYK